MTWEFTLLDALQRARTPALDVFFRAVTGLGDAGIFWILLGAVLLLFKRTRICGLCVLTSLALGAAATNLILKPLAARPRPCWINDTVQLLVRMPRDYSFPSGHAQASFAVACAVCRNNRRWGIALLALAVLIAFSRLYLYVHFPTDVLFGGLLGAAVGTATSAFLIRLIRQKHAQGKWQAL